MHSSQKKSNNKRVRFALPVDDGNKKRRRDVKGVLSPVIMPLLAISTCFSSGEKRGNKKISREILPECKFMPPRSEDDNDEGSSSSSAASSSAASSVTGDHAASSVAAPSVSSSVVLSSAASVSSLANNLPSVGDKYNMNYNGRVHEVRVNEVRLHTQNVSVSSDPERVTVRWKNGLVSDYSLREFSNMVKNGDAIKITKKKAPWHPLVSIGDNFRANFLVTGGNSYDDDAYGTVTGYKLNGVGWQTIITWDDNSTTAFFNRKLEKYMRDNNITRINTTRDPPAIEIGKHVSVLYGSNSYTAVIIDPSKHPHIGPLAPLWEDCVRLVWDNTHGHEFTDYSRTVFNQAVIKGYIFETQCN